MPSTPDDDAWSGDVLDALDVGVFRIDQVTERIVRINQACARIFGFARPKDAVGTSALAMYEDPRERREVATRFEANDEYKRTGIAWLEGRRVRIDTREPFDAQIRLKATLDPSGRTRFIEGIITKAGAPSATMQAYRIGEQRFRALFDSSSAPMAIAQVDGTLSRVNAAFCAFLAREEMALVGTGFFSFIYEGDRDGRGDEKRFVRGDGAIAWGQVAWSPIKDDHGNESAVVVVQDLTERKRAEKSLLRAEKLESLGVLAGGIAHDFNNVLAVVLGTLTLAARQPDAGPATRALLVEAEQAADRARRLAKQLVTFAKGGTPVKRVGSLAPVLRTAVAYAARTVPESVVVEEGLPGDLWLVDIDAEQMTQVFHNLLLNAAQAMPHGGRMRIEAENTELGATAGDVAPPGRYVRTRVIDSGIGVDPKHIDRIFDPYFTTKASGTGLGLATVHSIVTRHGGHVAVESTAGVGTVFTVLLPAAATTLAERDEPRPAPTARTRVLLVDDDDLVRKMTRRILESSGFDVADFADGAPAIDRYDRARAVGEPFHIVLLDLVARQGVGGIESLARIRAIDPFVRAIVVSGYSDDPVMADPRSFGFVDAIAKPFTADRLADVVARAVARER